MKFQIIGDLHGRMPRLHYKEYDAIIVPGDVCGDKGIRNHLSRAYKAFLKDPEKAKTWQELAGKKEARRLLERSIADGRRVMEFLNRQGKPVIAIPGNWDPTERDEVLVKRGFGTFNDIISDLDNVYNVDERRKRMFDHDFIGYGEVNGPELMEKRGYEKIFTEKVLEQNRRDYESLRIFYRRLFMKASKPVIFLSHNIPYKTALDKIIDERSPRNGWHYGSLLAREMIDEFQPLACIGGHMHEYHDSVKIKKTTVINAGFGGKVNTLLELEKGRIKRLSFYPGRERKK